ncbi:hypothetical protein NQ314_016717, partial [Rhamnusium bicolor]
ANFTGASFTLSEDQAFILIRYNVSSVFRHSTTSQFIVYDIVNRIYYDVANRTSIQLATFAPTGHGLVYVFENNIYYLENFAVDVDNPVPVTTIGQPGFIYCGVPDWVYEEEVLGSGSALWISPNATYIAYAAFHDENVTEFSYYIYGTPGALQAQYPTEAKIKYPKVGTPNPLVYVYLYNINTKDTIEFQLPPTIDNKATNDYVLYDLTWVSDTEVSMISTNRIQNESIIIRCNLDGLCQEEDSYKEENGWLEPRSPKYSKDGKKRIEILGQPEGDDKFYHLVLTDIEKDNKTRLTFGRRVVTTIFGWDEDRGLIYYGGSVIDTPSQQQVYVVSTEGVNKCLTCDMVVDGDKCQYASASFSTSLSYHVKVCSGPNPIYVQVENTQDENDVILWQDNEILRNRLAAKYLPIIKKLTVPLNNQFIARVKILLPPNLDESSSKKYPAIVNTYLRDNLPYIDPSRIGIWGWSYGGFASSWALVKDTEHVFNFALAVAPVTSFIYYERYMGLPTPEDNEIGYNNTDLSRNAEAFRGRRYFIIHGNGDDNVHYQNSMALVKALEHADIDFRQQSYPDENHSLGHVSRHLYHTIDKFWARCFDVEGPPVAGWKEDKNVL